MGATQQLLASGGGALWTPANLATPPFGWYNDSSGMILTGSSVDRWDDIGTGGFNLSQSVSADKPLRISSGLNGRRTVLFDGTTEHLDTAGLVGARQVFKNVTQGMMCVLYKKTATDAGVNRIVAINYTGSGGSRLTLAASDTVAGRENRPRIVARRLDADAAAQLVGAASGSTAWQMVLATMDWASGDGTLYIDGSQAAQNLSLTSSGATSNTDGNLAFSIGADATGATAADIEMAEYFHVAYVPTASEIDKIFGYLAWRWGLQSSLPVTSPYKGAPPYR